VLASVHNPYVVKLFYSFQDEEFLYLVMEYLPGGDVMVRAGAGEGACIARGHESGGLGGLLQLSSCESGGLGGLVQLSGFLAAHVPGDTVTARAAARGMAIGAQTKQVCRPGGMGHCIGLWRPHAAAGAPRHSPL
jgi:hypothetical protein